jgi:AraC-like DNA-binding protein
MDYRIVDVMTECGFKNQSSFNRVFFDACQMSPKQYRKSKRPQANICS